MHTYLQTYNFLNLLVFLVDIGVKLIHGMGDTQLNICNAK